ncbi:MAG: HAD family hydrolase [Granulosicoccus sp.]
MNSNAHELSAKTHWLFDMDGTLTCAMHDFDAIRYSLNLPADVPILEAIARLPDKQAVEKHAELNVMEMRLAYNATAQPGALELLSALKDKQASIGIVTRNGKRIAEATLDACGLAEFFVADTIISRDCCSAKPDPAGVKLLLSRWSARPSTAVMVGDYKFDLEAGRRAGVTTVHLAVDGNHAWPELTDMAVSSLQQLTEASCNGRIP